MYEKIFEKKILVPRDPLGIPKVPILGPARGIFSKLNGPCPLGSVGHSHTSFSAGEFRAAQRTLGSDVVNIFTDGSKDGFRTGAAVVIRDGGQTCIDDEGNERSYQYHLTACSARIY